MTDHVYWKDGVLCLLDQRLLPFKKSYVRCRTLGAVADALTNMTVRGAPLIGVVAAYGVVVGLQEVVKKGKDPDDTVIQKIFTTLAGTRPTAVNLFWALDRMKRVYEKCNYSKNFLEEMFNAAVAIHGEDIENNRMLSLFGAELIADGDTVLTHCNAGALATGGYGTALGVIRAANESGKRIRVIATETRPYLQGARLTAWELYREGIDVQVVPDNHVGFLCENRMIDKVIVGADRIALNGDTANKIGTYMNALCSHQHRIPFYVAAPVSTFDPKIPNGAYIEIEERDEQEVKTIGGVPIMAKGIRARYFSFDVTPARFITSFITEKGIIMKPFRNYIKLLFRS